MDHNLPNLARKNQQILQDYASPPKRQRPGEVNYHLRRKIKLTQPQVNQLTILRTRCKVNRPVMVSVNVPHNLVASKDHAERMLEEAVWLIEGRWSDIKCRYLKNIRRMSFSPNLIDRLEKLHFFQDHLTMLDSRCNGRQRSFTKRTAPIGYHWEVHIEHSPQEFCGSVNAQP